MSRSKMKGRLSPDASAQFIELIRSIRQRRRMNTSEFGRELGVAQSVVSRYENGSRFPGWRPLTRLLLLAEGAEKGHVLQALSAIRGRPVDEAEATQEAKRVVEEDEFLLKTADLPDILERGQFASLARAIMTNEKWCIDEPLNKILSLWLKSAHHPWAHRCFADAARFLEVTILAREAEMKDGVAPPSLKQAVGGGGTAAHHVSSRGMATYRVTAPVIDFGDGVLHALGETVLLDLGTAKAFSFYLIRIDQPAGIETDDVKKLA